MAADALSSVYAVFADEAEAARIGRDVVTGRLAACVNLLGTIRSFYWWRGQLEEANEFAAIFKTTEAGVDALIAAIAEAHSYDTAAVSAWPISAVHPPYGQWILEEVR